MTEKLKILQIGVPVLRQPARPLTSKEILSHSIQSLIQKMRATMNAAPGVGLAAPQIGESIQLAVIEDKKEYHQNFTSEQLTERERVPVPFHVIINPKLTILSSEAKHFFEGCLSVAGFMGLASRAYAVKVDCLNEKAEPVTIEATGWYARILQHEIDHLQGTVYIDRINPRSLMLIENYAAHWKDKSIEQTCGELHMELQHR